MLDDTCQLVGWKNCLLRRSRLKGVWKIGIRNINPVARRAVSQGFPACSEGERVLSALTVERTWISPVDMCSIIRMSPTAAGRSPRRMERELIFRFKVSKLQFWSKKSVTTLEHLPRDYHTVGSTHSLWWHPQIRVLNF